MLLLPSPKRLMLGYVLGAYTTSITLGLVIVFSLHGSSTESTSKNTISPVEDIVIGLLLIVIAWVLHTGRDQPFEQRRRDKKEAKLKAKEAATKVVALSAYSDRGSVMEMLCSGAVGYLVKGTAPREILEAVRRATRSQASLSADVTASVIEALFQDIDERRQSEERVAAKREEVPRPAAASRR
jgi:predicted DNA-binding transcriptional regulator